ncbi:MAG: MFS transporter [Gammaproteobacteria bacterium]|nr:MFS transporter [Gammaproteobacteria bacterium]
MVESALGYPQFRRYWIARLYGSAASQMQAVAVGWQVYDMTGRAIDLGWVGLSLFLPQLALALITGQVADHYDRRRVLALATLLDGACVTMLLGLTVAGNRDPRWIFLILVLTGSARAFQVPASFALMPNLVRPIAYPSAAAWVSTAWQTASILGPALGGILYLVGPVTTYGVCVLLLILSAAMVMTLQLAGAAQKVRGMDWSSTLVGVHFIRTHPLVLGAISLDLFAVLLGGATALLPIYARDILEVGPSGLGILRSAPAVGALIAAVIMLRFPIRSNTGFALLGWVAVFGLATIAFGVSTDLRVSLAMLTLLGAADMVSVIIRRVLIQIATPDEMRGRVSAVESVFIGASNELGEFRAGVSAAFFGTVPAVVIGGIGTVLVVALWAKMFPSLRTVDRLESVASQ